MKVNLPTRVGTRVAVCVSGGFDSAVLWHMVKQECNEREMECKAYTVPKADGAVFHANNVLERFGYEHKTIVVGNIDSDNPTDHLNSGVWEIYKQGLADVVYTAVTAYYEGMSPINARTFTKGTKYEDFVRQPFADMTKDAVVKLAFDLGIEKDVMEVTHSCTTQERGRCKTCPWCVERDWAFKQINKEDIGKE